MYFYEFIVHLCVIKDNDPAIMNEKMKRRLFVMLMAVAAVGAWAKGEVEFASREHDFGTIKASAGAVTANYEFTNTGDEPVSIVTVTNGGCGCTKPSFPLQPIAPGKKGVIKINFNPATFKGEFRRSVKVQFSNSRKRTVLKFNGVVIPK